MTDAPAVGRFTASPTSGAPGPPAGAGRTLPPLVVTKVVTVTGSAYAAVGSSARVTAPTVKQRLSKQTSYSVVVRYGRRTYRDDNFRAVSRRTARARAVRVRLRMGTGAPHRPPQATPSRRTASQSARSRTRPSS